MKLSHPAFVWSRWTPMSYVAFFWGLSIPISTAAQNLGALLFFLAGVVLIVQSFRRGAGLSVLRDLIKSHAFIACGTALGLLLWLGLLWTPDLHAGMKFISKMRLYWLLPVVAMAMLPRLALPLIGGFATASLLAVVLSLAAAFTHGVFFTTIAENWFTAHHTTIGNWFIFRTHAYHNHFAGLLAAGLLAILLTIPMRWVERCLLIGIIVISLYDIFFLVQGRTGHLTTIVMLGLVMVGRFPKSGILAFAGMVMAATLVLPKYSPVIQSRIADTQSDIEQYQQGNHNTSIGLRLNWYANLANMIREKPLLGYGTGSFNSVYNQFLQRKTPQSVEDNKDTATKDSTTNPHNDYLFIWSQIGLMGFLLMLGLMLSAIWQGRHLLIPWRLMLYATQGGFFVATIANSFFTDNTGNVAYFALTLALLAGPKKTDTTATTDSHYD